MPRLPLLLVCSVLLGPFLAAPAAANCLPMVQGPAGVVPAAFAPGAAWPGRPAVQPDASPAAIGEPLEPDQARITFLGHASFLIEGPEGATAITDYNGYNEPGGGFVPDVVTMNNSHSTHWTPNPNPAIPHVLRGWGSGEEGFAQHDVTVGGMRVRNVPTNARSFTGGGVRYNGNSIFVFEVASLCVAHLGHLHHTLSDQHLGELGQIDVLLVPADGAWTMNHLEAAKVVEQIMPSVVIPMHYFGSRPLNGFLAALDDRWTVRYENEPSLTVSRLDLPFREVIVLPGR